MQVYFMWFLGGFYDSSALSNSACSFDQSFKVVNAGMSFLFSSLYRVLPKDNLQSMESFRRPLVIVNDDGLNKKANLSRSMRKD